MTTQGLHQRSTREEWTAARLELLKAEKELTRHSDQVAQMRQELQWVQIEKEYQFETDEGSATLADLFAELRACQDGAMTGTDVATYTREREGMSAFVIEDSVIYHTYSTYARGVDAIWAKYQWLDRTPKGRKGRAPGRTAPGTVEASR